MTSSMLCAPVGIDNPELFENSASYIAGWLSALNEDKKLVVAAAAHAQRACDLISQAEGEATRHATSTRQPAVAGSEPVPATASTSPAPGPRNASHDRARHPDTADNHSGPRRGDLLTRRAEVLPAGETAPGREHDAGARRWPQAVGDWQAEAGG